MSKLADRAKMFTSTVGVGELVLTDTVASHQSFGDAGVLNGETVSYAIEDGTSWEIGRGTYNASLFTLTRTVTASSNNNNEIVLTGNAVVYITALSTDLVTPDILSTVATTGAYSDLSGLPTLGTAAATAATDYATAAQGVDATDTKEKLSILTPEQGVDADAAAWLAAVTGSVTPSVQSLVVSAISQLKETGVWSALDVINVDLGVSEQAALINLKDPANIHTNNGATYVRGQGFKGNGTDAWIDTGLDVTTLAGYSQSDAHLGSWETEDIAASDRSIGTSGAIGAYISGRLAGGSFSARINDATADAVAVDTSLGLSGVNRSGATARELYRNGLLVASDAQASTSIVGAGNLSVLRSNALYSNRRVWAYTAGSSLTAAQWGSLFAILNNVRDKVVDSISLAPTEARLVVQTVPVVANAITVSMGDGHAVEVPLDANVTTVTVTDWPQSVAQVRFYFTQDATGGRTVTFPVGWIGTASPSATANFVTEIIAESLDGGATIRLKQGETWNG